MKKQNSKSFLAGNTWANGLVIESVVCRDKYRHAAKPVRVADNYPDTDPA